jgi:hypothetical protein
MGATEIADEVREQLVHILQIAQENVVGALEAVTEQAQRLLPQYAVEFADKLPSATQIVDRGFDRAEQMLQSQRQFASKVAGGFDATA